MKNAVEIHGLEKKYSNFSLGTLDVEIPSGYIIGLIGENGAGKTTLIKAMLNIIGIDNGNIKIFGKDYKKEEASIKEEIGVVLDNMFFPEILNAENIDSVMKAIYKNWDSPLFEKYLTDFKIPSNKPLKSLSKGMRKKVELAAALSHHPKLLILDEPTSGLDPVVRNEVSDIFLDFVKDEEHTILFSTHITSDLEHIADKIIFINEGEIILDADKDEIVDSYGILKCEIDSFDEIDANDIIRYKKNKYNYDILVQNRSQISRKYPNFVVDKITLEDLMVLMIRGNK